MLRSLIDKIPVEKLIQRFIAAWCCINIYSQFSSDTVFNHISYAFNINLPMYSALFLLIFAVITAISTVFRKRPVDSWAFAVSFGIYAVYTLTINREFWYCMSLTVLAAIALNFLLRDDALHLGKIRFGKKAAIATVVICGVIISASITLLTCLRYATYSSPNYDFGIWCNMFHHMKEGFLPIVSSERDKLLSHFAVHISPIYYLILPFYVLFPSPYTLQVSQALVIASGIIPVFLLARHKKLSYKFTAVLCVAYAFSPALFCGTNYDLHENCFLVPLLLWMFYFYEKEKHLLMYLAAAGVFMIKEDAALFVLFFGIYAFLSGKKYLHGTILAIVSVIYFAAAIYILNKYGDGVLSNRFNNYMYEDEGLPGMAKIILANPAYVFTQTLNPEKIIYLLQLLLPLGFLPLATKHVSRFILLLPFMLINLMTFYAYQFSIDFQYSFGPVACMIYLAIINAADLKGGPRRYLTSLAAICAVMIFTVTGYSKLHFLTNRYDEGRTEFSVLNTALATIPEDASVKASTFLVPHIAQRDEIYEIISENETDYAVFDMRGNLADETTTIRQQHLMAGYIIETEVENYIIIMRHPDYQPAHFTQGE